MLGNYFLIAYRTLRKRPGATAINVIGLAVGLAALAVSTQVLRAARLDPVEALQDE